MGEACGMGESLSPRHPTPGYLWTHAPQVEGLELDELMSPQIRGSRESRVLGFRGRDFGQVGFLGPWLQGLQEGRIKCSHIRGRRRRKTRPSDLGTPGSLPHTAHECATTVPEPAPQYPSVPQIPTPYTGSLSRGRTGNVYHPLPFPHVARPLPPTH